MSKKAQAKPRKLIILMVAIIVLQVIAALCFCNAKKGFHYDENYSYYSSNVTAGLRLPDNGWMKGSDIRDEFRVTEGMTFNYSVVKTMQSFDVHPPLYYYVLHTVCSFTPGIYSKWQGLAINIVFYVIFLVLLGIIAWDISDKDSKVALSVVLLAGFSPAVISGVTFIRMYMMLTALCMLSILIHLEAIREPVKIGWRFYLAVLATTLTGFMTHYYYAVFLFFEASFVCIYLWIKREHRKKSYIYAISVLTGMVLEVVHFPSTASHILKGYRGTEAIGAFLDAGNIAFRASLFVGLLDEYVLPGCFYILLLICVLAAVTCTGLKRRAIKDIRVIFLLYVTLGYFIVVLKTALTNAEEAIRYELPVYGLIILLLTMGIMKLLPLCVRWREVEKVATGVVLIAIICQIYTLIQGKVLFLYTEDEADIKWAAEHSEDCVVYVYNPVNQWMIWDAAPELMEYKEIYFVRADIAEDAVIDSGVKEAGEIWMYSSRSDEAEICAEKIIDECEYIDSRELTRELLYADLYRCR